MKHQYELNALADMVIGRATKGQTECVATVHYQGPSMHLWDSLTDDDYRAEAERNIKDNVAKRVKWGEFEIKIDRFNSCSPMDYQVKIVF